MEDIYKPYSYTSLCTHMSFAVDRIIVEWTFGLNQFPPKVTLRFKRNKPADSI